MASESSKASEIVKVLTVFLEDVSAPMALHHFRLLYGLLRQSPGTWSVHALGLAQDFIHHHGRGRKRKASA